MTEPLTPGLQAPSFSLPDQHGRMRALADFRGRWLVLYFYPRDDTPHCTREACEVRDRSVEFDKLGAWVVGVSLDSIARHARFAMRHALDFPLLVDAAGETARRYGALFRIGPFKLARRHTFVIAPDGRIAKIYRKVRVARHADELLRDLGALQQEEADA